MTWQVERGWGTGGQCRGHRARHGETRGWGGVELVGTRPGEVEWGLEPGPTAERSIQRQQVVSEEVGFEAERIKSRPPLTG